MVASSSFPPFSSPSTAAAPAAAGMDPNGLKTGGIEISLDLSIFFMNFISLIVPDRKGVSFCPDLYIIVQMSS